MPVISGLTDPLMVKLFHRGRSDKAIAEEFGISVQAVSKRRVRLGLIRNPVIGEVNKGLGVRWNIYNSQGNETHHKSHAIKSLRLWLRLQLGDQSLSEEQEAMAKGWAEERRLRGDVLCYDRESAQGWYYRPRLPSDRGLLIDWPEDLPFPSDRFRQALTLPQEPVKASS